MRCRLLASIVILALGAVDNAQGDWRNYPTNRAGLNGGRQRGDRRLRYTPYTDWRADSAVNRVPAANSKNGSFSRADWRAYGAVNRVSPDGLWQRGYGRMGYGWYSAYGDYVGSDYSTLGFGNRSRAAGGFNFNRVDNYGFIDPRAIGERPR